MSKSSCHRWDRGRIERGGRPSRSPLALSVTVCAAPLTTAVLMVLVQPCPWITFRMAGWRYREVSVGDGGEKL